MRVVPGSDVWVQCRKPSGCGWYWRRRTVKAHWWSRPAFQYMGAYWEDEEGSTDLSHRPGDWRMARDWLSQELWEDYYGGDCERHLQEIPNLNDVQANSAMRR